MSIKIKEGDLATLDLVESFRFTVKADINLGRSMFNQQRLWKIINKNNDNIEIQTK
jgi:hypothetical protein